MKVGFHPEARKEFLQAIEFYESRHSGLGHQFRAEVEETVERVRRLPKTWPVLKRSVRRCLTHRFPYGVLYCVEPDRIYVVAVMHLRRRPDYWGDRI